MNIKKLTEESRDLLVTFFQKHGRLLSACHKIIHRAHDVFDYGSFALRNEQFYWSWPCQGEFGPRPGRPYPLQDYVLFELAGALSSEACFHGVNVQLKSPEDYLKKHNPLLPREKEQAVVKIYDALQKIETAICVHWERMGAEPPTSDFVLSWLVSECYETRRKPSLLNIFDEAVVGATTTRLRTAKLLSPQT